MYRLVVIGIVVAAACRGGGGSGTTRDVHRPTPTPGTERAAAVAEAGPSERECDQLFHHAIEVIATPDVSPADREATFAAMHDRFVAGCRALSRARFDCATAATTLDDMLACDGGKRAGVYTVGPHDRMPVR
jgi:hypothetical protein